MRRRLTARWIGAACALLMLLALPCALGRAEDAAVTGERLLEVLPILPERSWALTLCEEAPFEPIALRAQDFDRTDTAFLQSLGLDENRVQDVSCSGQQSWTGVTNGGRTVTLLFCGAYGEEIFVFDRLAGGTERLIDVLYCSSSVPAEAGLVSCGSEDYLLVTDYGHGTGTLTRYTSLYSLNRRSVSLRYLREGRLNEEGVTAQIVTHTSLDKHPCGAAVLELGEPLLLYSYAAVTVSDSAEPRDVRVISQRCTVYGFEARDGGLLPTLKRTFAGIAPSVIEGMSVDELAGSALAVDGIADVPQEDVRRQPGILEDEALVRDLQAIGRGARVVNADWVNLRQSTSKSSPALTTVDSTQTVTILRERCGEDEGWTRVLVVDAQGTAWTGYIWWSFLKKE